MGNLVKFEFYKLFRQKSFYICSAIMVGLILISTFTLNMLVNISQGAMGADGVTVSMMGDMELSGIYMLTGALAGNDISIILAVLLALFICTDYTNGTLKNVIAKGYNRISVYGAKFVVSLVAATILAVISWLTGFVSGTVCWGVGNLSDGVNVGRIILILAVQLLGMYAYTSFFFLICVLLKKTGGAIAVGIVTPLVLSIVLSLVDILAKKLSFSFVPSEYWMDTCFMEVSVSSVASDIMTRSIICFAIYIVIFAVGGHFIARKSEV